MKMKKELNQTGTENQIDINNQQEVKRWCSELQCNEMRLKNAVRAVGPSAEAVRKYMTKKF
jgi:hypothetical protein